MFNIGPGEIVILTIIALLVFGPKRLPELGKGLGKGLRDFKKALEGKEKESLPKDDQAAIDVTKTDSEETKDKPES